jgi:hypothetical protein
MSATAENIKVQINQWVRNYAVEAFQDQRLNRILLQMVDFIDVVTGGGGSGSAVVELTSANFINATDCPLTTLADKNIAVFFNENSRFLIKADGEWSDLPGGGFRIDLAGFDSGTQNFHFYVFTL